jgi:hypothetical protein
LWLLKEAKEEDDDDWLKRLPPLLVMPAGIGSGLAGDGVGEGLRCVTAPLLVDEAAVGDDDDAAPPAAAAAAAIPLPSPANCSGVSAPPPLPFEPEELLTPLACILTDMLVFSLAASVVCVPQRPRPTGTGTQPARKEGEGKPREAGLREGGWAADSSNGTSGNTQASTIAHTHAHPKGARGAMATREAAAQNQTQRKKHA